LAATTQQPAVLLLGVAVFFGGANGLAYGVSVGLAARARPSLRGTATGLVVGAHAAGPVLLGLVAPKALDAFGRRSDAWPWRWPGLLTIAAELAPGQVPAARRPSRLDAIPRRDVVLLWIVFAGGTAPGPTLFAHAVTVAGDRRSSAQAAELAVSALAAGDLIGRLSGGGEPADVTAGAESAGLSRRAGSPGSPAAGPGLRRGGAGRGSVHRVAAIGPVHGDPPQMVVHAHAHGG
jgi:MFS family permease